MLQTATNENLSNKPYFCLGLLANLADLLRQVDARSIILGIFDPFYPSWGGIPLVTLDDYWVKQTLFKFYMFPTILKYGRSITSKTEAPLLTGLYCTCSTDCYDLSVLLLFSGAMLGSWLGVFLGYSIRSRLNQVSLRSIFFGTRIFKLRCTRSVQFRGIVRSLINGTVENLS